jgi:hypothetical protein
MQVAGVMQSLFLIRYIYLMGVWFGEDQIINTIKTQVLLRGWTTSSNFINHSTLQNEHKWADHIFIEETNKHAPLTTIKYSGEVRFLLMLHISRFAYATQVPFHCVNLINRSWRT